MKKITVIFLAVLLLLCLTGYWFTRKQTTEKSSQETNTANEEISESNGDASAQSEESLDNPEQDVEEETDIPIDESESSAGM